MFKWGGCTDVGQTRPINEDGYYISEYSEALDAIYAMVADGMGGHRAGEVASTLAIREISEVINQGFSLDMTVADSKELLAKAVKRANRVIYDKSMEEAGCRGMGTTLTLCFAYGDKAMIAHVGDSRAYLLRGGVLHRITADHSLVQELLSSGRITEEEAEHHPQKNVITRALGTDSDVEIDLYEFTLHAGDMILLCTDGFSNMLTDAEIKKLLQDGQDTALDRLAEQLVTAANLAGGYDNITAVLLTKESGLR